MYSPVHNVFREDEVTNGDDRENMLKNAPQKKEGTYMVPKNLCLISGMEEAYEFNEFDSGCTRKKRFKPGKLP